jgi:predicted RNA-binding protein with PIN domain
MIGEERGDSRMRILVDGYNLMHAKGLMPRGTRPAGLHHARRRFLDALAVALGPVASAETTVVFDAAHPPPERPDAMRFGGMSVVFAVGEGDADSRIEALIARHSVPRRLIVISSDRRIRRAAGRRGARSIDADTFWSAPRRAVADVATGPAPEARPGSVAPEGPPDLAERRRWAETFADADAALAAAGAAPGDVSGFAPTDEELRRIAREVEAEEREPFRGRAFPR